MDIYIYYILPLVFLNSERLCHPTPKLKPVRGQIATELPWTQNSRWREPINMEIGQAETVLKGPTCQWELYCNIPYIYQHLAKYYGQCVSNTDQECGLKVYSGLLKGGSEHSVEGFMSWRWGQVETLWVWNHYGALSVKTDGWKMKDLRSPHQHGWFDNIKTWLRKLVIWSIPI